MQHIRAIGSIIKQMERGNSLNRLVAFMMVIGLTESHLGTGRSSIFQEHSTLANGSRINNMVTESKHGQTGRNMKVTM